MSFYKTNSTEVLKVFDQHYAERKILFHACNNFASLFKEDDTDVKVFYRQSPHDVKFGGLKFYPVKNHPSWTKPDRKNGGQIVRQTLKKSTKAQREAHKILFNHWIDNVPQQKCNYEPIFDSVGTNWSDIAYSRGFRFFKYLEFAYIKTHIKLNQNFTEILGSEFELANKLYEEFNQD